MGVKTVDKNIDKKNKQWFGCFNATQKTLMSFFMASGRAESATFLFATMMEGRIPCSDQKIARFCDHLSESYLGTHIGQKLHNHF